MTEATASTPRTSSHHRSMTGPVGISTSNYKSLNDKISHIESMLRRIQQEEDEDNDQLVKLMEKSEQLQQKAHRHIERCGSMKTILVAPRAQETVRPVA
jgi:predicted  nucleic acid-binding Zn-ribbon protein